MDIFLSFMICFVINLVISAIFQALIPNYFIASMLTSIVIAMIYAIMVLPFDRLRFYKQRSFWVSFFVMSIIFLLLDCLTFMLEGF
jgi:hypothetical protein